MYYYINKTYFLLALLFLNITLNAGIKRYFNEDFNLAKNDTIQSDIAVWNGNANIYGIVVGNVTTYSGNINIGKIGKIIGKYKAFGGKVIKANKVDEKKSFYQIDMFQNLPTELADNFNFFKLDNIFNDDTKDSLSAKEINFHYHDSFLHRNNIAYSKVDGLYLGLKTNVSLSLDKDSTLFAVKLYGDGGYVFRRKVWQYFAGVSSSFHNELFTFGASQYSGSATEDQWKLSKSANTLAALFIHEDFYNYYLLEGHDFFTMLKYSYNYNDFNSIFGIKGVYRDNKIETARNKTDYSLFGGDKHFSPNLVLDQEGNLKEVVLNGFAFMDFNDISLAITGDYEKTPKGLDQDFNFEKFVFSFNLNSKIKSLFTVKNYFRLTSSTPNSPNFKRTYLGGTSTLPGYKFNEFFGNRSIYNRFVVGNFYRNLKRVSFIFDVGDAWQSNSYDLLAGFKEKGMSHIHSSFGVGFKLFDRVSFSVHKRLDTNDSPYQFQLTIDKIFGN